MEGKKFYFAYPKEGGVINVFYNEITHLYCQIELNKSKISFTVEQNVHPAVALSRITSQGMQPGDGVEYAAASMTFEKSVKSLQNSLL